MSVTATFDSWLAGLPSETYTLEDAQIPGFITNNLRRMLTKGIGTDVTLACDGKTMKCHRAVLEMYSSVIATTLESGLKETKSNEIEFKDISFDLLEKAVGFLYGSNLEITAQDVMPLLQFADMYDVTPLRESCGKMLMKHVIPSVAMTVCVSAKRYNAPAFYTNAHKYCATVFGDAYDKEREFTDEFLLAEKDVIIDLLTDSELKISAENDVLDVIIAWVTYKQDERSAFAQEILKACVRCGMMTVHEAHCSLQRFGVSRLNDELKATLFGFCFDLSALELSNPLLPPRQNTREIAALSCCVFAEKALVVVSNQIREDRLVEAATSEIRSYQSDIHATYIINNEMLTRTMKKENAVQKKRQGQWVVIYPVQMTLFHSGTVHQTQQEKEISTHRSEKVEDFGQVLVYSVGDATLIKVMKKGQFVTLIKMSNLWTTKYEKQTKLPMMAKNLHLIVCYHNSLILFAPEAYEAYVFDARDGTFSKYVSVDFQDDVACTAIASKHNISCLISQEFIYVVRLNLLLLTKPEEENIDTDDDSSDTSDDDNDDKEASAAHDVNDDGRKDDGNDVDDDNLSADVKDDGDNVDRNDEDAEDIELDDLCADVENEDAIMTRVWAPASAQGKLLTSAVIYGDHLYVAESPVTDGELVLHATDVNDLLTLGNDGCPRWEKHVIALSHAARNHLNDAKASVSLFMTRLKNLSH